MDLQLHSGETKRIEICFSRVHDRYQQTWWLVEGDRRIEVMRSVEGDATMDWPQSPPIQDLSFESRGEFDVVLGLGQAGTSHWSSSFKSCPEELSIEAEHACRAKCDVQMLGCRYQVSKNWQIELVNGSIGLLNPEVQNRLQIMSSNIETIEKQEFVCRPCLDTANSGDLQTFIWQMGVQIIN